MIFTYKFLDTHILYVYISIYIISQISKYYISTFNHVSTMINFWTFLVLPKIIQLIQVSVGCQKKLVASDLSVNPDGLSHSPNDLGSFPRII